MVKLRFQNAGMVVVIIKWQKLALVFKISLFLRPKSEFFFPIFYVFLLVISIGIILLGKVGSGVIVIFCHVVLLLIIVLGASE